ncbi:Inverted formin-2 [Toxocara canis]|uniref:Inverted formin-2 n=1 Tax=Toxocara canis TaxID=6265 RepID=A0A0B2VY75_TOXCA|nr:Inverted formin-2 [Toxocara canis]
MANGTNRHKKKRKVKTSSKGAVTTSVAESGNIEKAIGVHHCGLDGNEVNSVPLSLNSDESYVTTVSVMDATKVASDCSCNSYVTAFTCSTPLCIEEADRTTGLNNDPYELVTTADFREEPDGASLARSTHGSIDSGNGPSPVPVVEAGCEEDSNSEEPLHLRPLNFVGNRSKHTVDQEVKTVRRLLDELQLAGVKDEVKAENMSSLNAMLLQCKGYLNRCYLRQDLMSLGLFDALPQLVESDNTHLTAQLDIFFSSESNDNLVTGTTNDTRHPIDVFHAAYLRLKKTRSASLLLDFLEKIASMQPNPKRMLRAIEALTRGHMRSVAAQTDRVEVHKDVELESDRAFERFARSRATTTSPTTDSAKTVLSRDVGQQLPSAMSQETIKEDALDLTIAAPLPKIVHRPRSLSRNASRPGKSGKKQEEKNDAKNKASETRVTPKCAPVLPTPPPPPPPPHHQKAPPPPPPPPPAFLNSALRQKADGSSGSPTIFKAASVYNKTRATNTINWEAVKPEVLITKTTVWSDQSGADTEFSQYQRDFLERVFERAPPNSHRLAGAQRRTRGLSVDTKKGEVIVCGLTEKRALNLGIVLARFRPDNADELIAKLESQEAVDLNVDYLTSLIKHFPTLDELAYFKKLSNSEDLKDAELFCYLAARHPNLKLRVELRVLSETVATDLCRQTQCARSVLVASEAVNDHKAINLFLHRCLQYGNFLNQSTFAAGASGFALSSLLSTLNAKGRGTTTCTRLVDILAETADEKLRRVTEVIGKIQPARGCSVEEIEKWEKGLRRSIENARKGLNECGDEELFRFYSPQMRDALAKCEQLTKTLREVRQNEARLRDFYCAETLSLETILDILYNSFTLFGTALKLAEEREVRLIRQGSLRAGAGRDLTPRRMARRRHTLDPPNVKDLISIINSTQCA